MCDTQNSTMQPRDVIATDDQVAWVEGEGQYVGSWCTTEDDAATAEESGETVRRVVVNDDGLRVVPGVNGWVHVAELMAMVGEHNHLAARVAALEEGERIAGIVRSAYLSPREGARL